MTEDKKTWVRMTLRKLGMREDEAEPGQTPAIECAVVLRGMSTAIVGAISDHGGTGLRMLSRDGGGFVEQFFAYEDVLIVAVQRPITIEPRIVGLT